MSAAPELGSRRALIMWGLAASMFLYAFLQRVTPSVMVEDLMRAFGVGAAALGNLSAVYLYAYGALQIPLGLLFDRFGARRLLAVSFLIAALGSLLMALAATFATALAGRALIGLGVACSWVGALTVATQWLPANRFAMFAGLTQALGMAGAIFGQAPLAEAVGAFGWRLTILAIGALGLAMASALWLVVRDRPRAPGHAPLHLAEALRAVLGLRETWACAAFGFALTGPMLAFAGLWAVPYLVAVYGLDRTTAAAISSLLFLGWGLTAPLIGLLSDRIGRRKPIMLVCTVIAGVMMTAIVFGPRWPTAIVAVLMFAQGGAASCMILAFALARDHSRAETSAAAMGVVNTAVVGAGAVLQPLVGLILDLTWDGTLIDGARAYDAASYRAALSILPLCIIAGIASLVAMRETPRGLG
jgi:MFS family permease